MKDQFVPYELAVKLKDLKIEVLDVFGEYFRMHDGSVRNILSSDCLDEYHPHPKFICLAPLWQQAFDWILEEHYLYGVIIPTISMSWTFKTLTCVDGMIEVPPYNHVDSYDYPTYDDAREAMLTKMIELINS